MQDKMLKCRTILQNQGGLVSLTIHNDLVLIIPCMQVSRGYAICFESVYTVADLEIQKGGFRYICM